MSTHIEIHPWKAEIDAYVADLLTKCKAEIEAARPSPVVHETRVEIRDATCTHEPELPGKGRIGQILTIGQEGIPSWLDQPKQEKYDDSALKKLLKEHQDLVDLVAQIVQERAVTNYEKEQLIKQLNDYWLDAHGDCFTETQDGRKIFRPELLTYKHDLALRNLTVQAPEPAQHTVERTIVQDPDKRVWLAVLAIAVVQLIYMVVHK
jgi:hypothetical protein